ncbi:protease [Rhodococcoides trifolii]|uniref:Protease n=1 Tax=Rhodococcoides trifolii TaxID=908250 RepID=A0A917D2J2_9NOCA|nr:alpha/beta fold hydrolase [Rhodococcus trifolii]GGG08726.1 protease [Rhodococcus trifolii]
MTSTFQVATGRRPLAIVAVLSAIALTAGCAAGPSTRPDVAVERSGGGAGAPESTTEDPGPAGPPPLEVPITDLAWQDCTASTTSRYGVTASASVVVECATFSAPIDASDVSLGTFDLAATRARLSTTPPEAAPLIYSPGSDRPASADIAVLAAQPDTSLLAAHPVVGVDRRGLGASAPFDCGTAMTDVRSQLADLGQFTPGSTDPVDTVASLGRDATIACTDFLQADALKFGNAASADDLEALRTALGVRTLGLVGSGNGALVALAYVSSHADNVSRLILDSPNSVNTDASSTTEQTVKGREAAFDAFAARCVASNCSLGADPRAATTELLSRAASGGLGPVSASSLLAAITRSLAFGSPVDAAARTTALSNTLSSAARGDTSALTAAVLATRADVGSDGQFVSRCTDGQQWPGPDRVRELRQSWGQSYPLFGADAALGMLACAAWPASSPSPLPGSIAVPVLVLSGNADPVVGNDGLPAVTGAIAATGATTASVTWQGFGHPVSILSSCARSSVVAYANDATLPGDGNACPA